MSVTSLNGIQNAVTAVSLNSGISISTAGQELNFNALSGGVTSVIADGQSTAGDITLVGAGNTTITNDGNNTITITSSGGGGGGSSITNGGSTLGLNATGSLSLTTLDTASNVNQINLATIVPTTTPGTNAGNITFTSSIPASNAVNSIGNINIGAIVGDNQTASNVGNVQIYTQGGGSNTGNQSASILLATLQGGTPSFPTSLPVGSIYMNGTTIVADPGGGNDGVSLTYSSVGTGWSSPANVGLLQLNGTDIQMTHNGITGNINGVFGWADSNAGNLWNVGNIYGNTPTSTGNQGGVQIIGSDNASNSNVLLNVGGASNASGLWVGKDNLTFNGAPVGGGGGGSSITNGGSTLGLDATGSLNLTTPDTASNVNQINLTTTVPTTTPGTGAGQILIDAGSGVTVYSQADIALAAGPFGKSALTLEGVNSDMTIALTGNTTPATNKFALTTSSTPSAVPGDTTSSIKFDSQNATNPGTLTVGGGVATTGLYVSNSQLSFNGAPLTGGTVGSAITGGGATVACDDPSGTGSITITPSASGTGSINMRATGTVGNITLDCESASSGQMTMKAKDVIFDLTNTGNGGVEIKTGSTISYFGGQDLSQNNNTISFATSGTNPGTLTIGGTPQTSGLYVSNTELLFNNTPVGGGGGGSSITNAGTTLSIDGTGNIVSAMTATATNENNILLSSISPVGSTPDTTTGLVRLRSNSNELTLDAVGNLYTGSSADPNTGNISGTIKILTQPGQNVYLGQSAGGTGVDVDTNGNLFLNATGTPPSATDDTNRIQITTTVPAGSGGQSGVISLTAGSSGSLGSIHIGGAVNTTGLYVSNTQLLFNNAPVGGGGGGSSISQAGGSVSVGTAGEVEIITAGASLATVNGSSITTLAKPGLEIAGTGSAVVCSFTGTTNVSATNGVIITNGEPLASYNNLSLGPADTQLQSSGNISLSCIAENAGDNITLSVAPVVPGVISTLTLTNTVGNPGAGTGWVFTPAHIYLNGVLIA